jgi:hypothetical protein
VDDHPEGFAQLASFLNSDDNFAVFRRFGRLSARALIQLQIDLTDLEKTLDELDKKDNADEVLVWRLRGCDDFEGWNPDQRDLLLSKILPKLSEYCISTCVSIQSKNWLT